MKIIETVEHFKRVRDEWHKQALTIGFVPTMGALHRGHASLVEAAKADCSRSVVSIFVNPTQFNDSTDLEKYPQPRAQDLELLQRWGVSAVFLPQAQEIYHDGYQFEVGEKELSSLLCGPTRPGHFGGVLTVVLKLLNIVRPRRAFFGEKDYQQLKLIEGMCAAFFLDSEIVPCPTVREPDGLALSSRNTRLSSEQRKLAPVLFRILSTAKTAADAEAQLHDVGFIVDYVEDRWGRRFAAVLLGTVRLIDNVVL